MNDALLRDLSLGVFVLLGVCVLIGLFLALRAVALWYWRVNDLHERLVETRDELRALRADLRRQANPTPTSTTAAKNANGSSAPASVSQEEGSRLETT